MIYKAYVTDSVDPYTNLAIEEYLFRYADKDTSILFLWQNDNTIVIGRNQDAKAECRADEFLESGGKIARRQSGGGAVYHDLGNLNFSMIGVKANVEFMSYKEILVRFISGYRLAPEYSGKNDILIKGHKFSGNAVYDNGRIVCQHGTIMVSCDVERMSYFLTPDDEKMKRHAIRSVSSRVVNLKEILPTITVDSLILQMQEFLNAQPLSVKFTEQLYGLKKKYEDESWIYGGMS